jgi:lipid-A-disaccharide synthase
LIREVFLTEEIKIAVSAGEPSGDAHASRLVRELSAVNGGLSFFGMGGEDLKSAGVRIDIPMERVSVVGISEVLSRLFDIYKAYRQFCRTIEKEKPQALIVVDFPDFNFRLIKFAKRLGIPVIYYITPQIWAWRKGRVKFLKKYVDLALAILPFEEEFLTSKGVNAIYVGHPILDRDYPLKPKKDFLAELNIGDSDLLVALMPGSRDSEISAHLPVLVASAEIMNQNFSNLRFLIPKAPNVSEKCWNVEFPPNCSLIGESFYEILAYSDLGAVASGTASLEAAIFGLPAVVFYSLNPLTYFLGRRLVKLPFISLPNIILGRNALQELIQSDFTPQKLAESLTDLRNSNDEKRKKAVEIKRELKKKLGEHGASRRAAEKIVDFLKGVK